MTEDRAKRKLTAILSADVKGYSRLMGENELATVRTLEANREMISVVIRDYSGRVVDSPGDNLLAEFASVVDAVECAVEIQKKLKTMNDELSKDRKMEFRIGINLGDVIEEGERIYGDGVNVAARIEGLADAGGICISGTAFDQVESKLSLEFEYLGEQSVKNIKKPIRVYRVKSESEVSNIETGRELPLPDKPSIAVLPFENMSGDPEQEYFSDGITEEIISGLCKIPYLFVIARNSSFEYKGKPTKVQQIGQELGVHYVLEGSIRKAGSRVRITAQLIDAKTGNHLWAERYDRDLKDIFDLQDEITMEIMTAMQVKLTEGEQARIYRKGTDNLDAYLKLLQGRERFHRMNKEDNVLAQQMFKEVIAIDPKYATAYRFLAQTHLMAVHLGSTNSPMESLDRAIELVQKALSFDDSLSGARGMLSQLYTMKNQHEKAITEGEKAIALNPNSADDHMHFALTLIFSGQPEEAILLLEKSIRLNPFPPSEYLLILGFAYREAERYEEAISAFKKALQQEPDNLLTHIHLAASYSSLGREKDARATVAEIFRIDPKFSLEYFIMTRPYKRPTDRERLNKTLRKAGLK